MSPNEYRMLCCCGLKKVIDEAGNLIPIYSYYKMAVEWCFLKKVEGPVADALRFAYLNIWINGSLVRDQSFEKLIGEYLGEETEVNG